LPWWAADACSWEWLAISSASSPLHLDLKNATENKEGPAVMWLAAETRAISAFFCNLSPQVVEQLDWIKTVASYPQGAKLFVEGQEARGIFILRRGRAKLSTSCTNGKTIILRIAEEGEVLGLGSAMTNQRYDLTAEVLEPTEADFISREEFLRFLARDGEGALRVARQLSENYHAARQEIRQFGLSGSASKKMAHLLLDWATHHGEHLSKEKDVPFTMNLTHEEIAQLIGSSRETVTRMFSDFKKKKLIEVKGTTVILRDRAALKKIVGD
jgi:CRP/FNR family transcriptional regulator